MNTQVVAELGWQDLLTLSLLGGLSVAIFTKVADYLLARVQRTSDHEHQQLIQAEELGQRREENAAALDQQAEMQRGDLAQKQELQALEQQHQIRGQDDARRHQALERLRDAHDQARKDLNNEAAAVRAWLDYQWGNDYGLERGDWVTEFEPRPRLVNVAQVLAALDALALTHPVRAVRATAASLRSSISGHFGSIREEWDDRTSSHVMRTGTTPSFEDYAQWMEQADSLIDLLHTPPTMSDGVAGGATEGQS